MTIRPALSLLVACVCLLSVRAGRAANPRPRSIPLAQHGQLVLKLQPGWIIEIPRQAASTSPRINIRPARGGNFQISLVIAWSPTGDPAFNSDEKVKAMADNLMGFLAPSAQEANLTLQEIKGAPAHGYYCTARDKAARPGSYEYTTSAVVGVGDLMLTATILTHSNDVQELRDSITMLQDAAQSIPGGKRR